MKRAMLILLGLSCLVLLPGCQFLSALSGSVTYDANGASGGSVPVDINRYQQGAKVTVLGNTGALVRVDWAFAGWNTKADGSGTSYAAGSTLTMSTPWVTLYAAWTQHLPHTVTYNGNNATDGKVPVDSNHYLIGAVVTVLGDTGNLVKTGYTLAGWNTKADGSGTSYAVGSYFWMYLTDVTLYAVWIPSNLTFLSSQTSIIITGYTTAPTGSLTIPGGVTGIVDGGLGNCSSLTSITIPSSVTRIDERVFGHCGLVDISVDPANPNYKSMPGVLLDRTGTILLEALGGLAGNYTIPSNVISIAPFAFYGCTNLTGITIPANITSIGYGAFEFCTSLISITIPSSVTVIREQVFFSCSSLTSLTVPASVTSIGNSTFSGCTSLTSITLPAGLTSIGWYLFDACTSLSSITIPAGVTTIGGDAFLYCASLTEITIPAGVTSIGSGAFDGCTLLTTVTVQATTPPSLEVGSRAFSYPGGGLQIHVPTVPLVATYQEAPGWSDYKYQIVSP